MNAQIAKMPEIKQKPNSSFDIVPLQIYRKAEAKIKRLELKIERMEKERVSIIKAFKEDLEALRERLIHSESERFHHFTHYKGIK
jgi:hypothetical protein